MTGSSPGVLPGEQDRDDVGALEVSVRSWFGLQSFDFHKQSLQRIIKALLETNFISLVIK